MSRRPSRTPHGVLISRSRPWPVVLLICLLAAPAISQVNTENMRPGNMVRGLSGNLGFSTEFHAGNIEYVDVGVRGRIDYDDSLWLAFLTGTFQLRSQSGNVFDRNGFFHLRYNRRIAGALILEVFAQQEYNKSLRLKNRALVGTGCRIPLLVSEALQLIIGTSWMYEYEERAERFEFPEPSIARAHRWNNYLVVRCHLDARLRIANTAYVQPRFDAFSDVRVLDDLTLVIDVTRTFAITNSVNYRFDNAPPPGIRKTDLGLRAGILFSF